MFNKALLFTTLAQKDLLRWLEKLTASKATVYDKALDSEYLKSHMGGGNHRLFDGGHDIFSAWGKAKNALEDDSFTQEVMGYAGALWKDLTTVKGLPFATITPETYEKLHNMIPGVSKEYLYDLLSFDALELLSTILGVVGAAFAIRNEDADRLSEIVGSLGVISMLSANPVMGVALIITVAYSYKKKSMKLNKLKVVQSAAVSTFTMTLFSLFGLPIIVELILVIFLSQLFKKKIVENSELMSYFAKRFSNNS